MVQSMRRNVARNYLKPEVRAQAVDIVRYLPARQDRQHLTAIRDWLKDRVKFLRDARDAEQNFEVTWMLKQIEHYGFVNVDCDDAAVLAAALGKSIGLRARFVCAAFGSKLAGFAHVWTDLSSPIGKPDWLDMDVTRAQQNLPIGGISRTMETEV